MQYCSTVLEQALRAGNKMHVFRSGGGLRVVRLEDKNQWLSGYGEHPSFEEAIKHAEEDYKAGCREYSTVYGVLYDHYLTGSATPSSLLDEWILKGHTIDAWFENETYIVELSGYSRKENTMWQKIKKTFTSSSLNAAFENVLNEDEVVIEPI